MGLKGFVGTFQVNRIRKKTIPVAMTFPSVLFRPRHVLVCLPSGLRELTLVKQFLPAISQMFKPADITLMSLPGVKLSDMYPRKGFQILSPTMDQLTWTGLPKKSYLEQLHACKFDAVLDLNLQSSLFIAAVLLSFPEALRIGRGNHLGDPFYNLEIKTRYLRDERNIYRSLLETLSRLMNKQVDGLAPLPISR